MDELEERIRAKAYELWVADGRPEGQHSRHWDEAREIIALQDAGGEPTIPLEATREVPAEPAIAQENQGEIPDLADQGEAVGGPEARRMDENADRRPLTVEDPPGRARGRSKKPVGEAPMPKRGRKSAASAEGPAQPVAGTESPKPKRGRKGIS